jgi:Tfp pilus assembly protein PilV
MVKINPSATKKAFSLVEVLTATIVMTMIMVSVIAYIQYGSLVWQKGHNKVSSENYSRTTFDLIKQDLLKATAIVDPIASSSPVFSDTLGYQLPGVTPEFKISRVTDNVVQRRVGGTDPALHKQWNARLARNAELFLVERLSTWTVKIYLQIRSDIEATEDVNFDGFIDFRDREIISSEAVVLTAPGAGG